MKNEPYVNKAWLAVPKIDPLTDTSLKSAPPLKWGIIGAGGIAGLFAHEVMASGGEIVAVASRTRAKADEFVAKFGSGRYGERVGNPPGGQAGDGGATIKKAYGTYEELFADPDVQAVYIATPHSDHATWALKALDAGKHLLIEKAITRNLQEAKDIFAKAKEKQLFVMEAMWTRFLPHIREVKDLVTSGKLGDIVTLQADFGIHKDYDPAHRLFNPDLAGGALLDLGIYPIAFAHHILGKPDIITSRMAKAPTGVDANLSLIFEYEGGSGTQALLHTTSLAQTSTRVAICGTKGRVEIDEPFYRPSNYRVIMNDGTTFTRKGKVEQVELFGEDGRYGMHFEAAEVARQIATGKLESDLMPWQHSLEIMSIMDQIREQHDFKFPGE